MTNAPPRPTSPQGRSLAARLAAGWLVAAALILASATVAPAADSLRPAGGSPAPIGVGAHLATVLDAAVVPTATVAVHSQAPRPLPAADVALLASAFLVLAAATVVAQAGRRHTPARDALPPRRGPPYRLLPR